MVGKTRIDVLHTPGHSYGGVCFLITPDDAIDCKPTMLISGDTVFPGSCGRTDLVRGHSHISSVVFARGIQLV
jgi:glyoxylase-like metal-dependent hydrolase (beta-lactamase superfamily II)